MPTAEQSAVLVELARQLAQAPRGGKGALKAAAAARLGVPKPTLERWLEQSGLYFHGPRKQRADAGTSALSLADATRLSAAIFATLRDNGKVGMTLDAALSSLRADGRIEALRLDKSTGELTALSNSAVLRALRGYGLDKQSIVKPKPAARLRTEHINELLEVDASVCILYYLPLGADPGHDKREPAFCLTPLKKEKHYKNKLHNLQAIERFRVIRYVATEHASGLGYARYYPHAESGEHTVDFIARCIAREAGRPTHGKPAKIMVDPGATASALVRRFCETLDIRLLVNQSGNARAKGQVEDWNNIFERGFEAPLTFKRHDIRDFGDLNGLVQPWLNWFNGSRIHSRHGMTRLAAWSTIAQEHLIETAPYRQLLQAVTGRVLTPRVSDQLTVRFEGAEWRVKHVPGVEIRKPLAVAWSPWVGEGAVALVTGEDGRRVQIPLDKIEKGWMGYDPKAAHVGEEFKSPPDTRAEANKKAVLEALTGETGVEKAEQLAGKKDFVPFGGDFDPHVQVKDYAAKVRHLPRPATPMAPPAVETAERKIEAIDACFTIREALGEGWNPEMFDWYAKRYSEGITAGALARLIETLKSGGDDHVAFG
jgi:hypothetical protein